MNILERYKGAETTKDNNKKEVYKSVIYPSIELDPTDIWTVVYESDRLDLLAYKYYNDVRYWWVIAEANGLGNGSMTVDPDTRLRIPNNIDKIISDFNSLNSNR
jgi:hypothetical protein